MRQPGIRRDLASEASACALAEELAANIKAGDLLTFTGPLGAGKTTLARALIRLLTGNSEEDVPSPTFTLVQTYDHARIPVWHFDLYRIERPDEIFELGFEEAESQGLSLVEWPDRMEAYLPPDRLEIEIDDRGGPETRYAVLIGHGSWTARLERMDALKCFLDRTGWGNALRLWLQGDASTRSYERLNFDGTQIVLMNAPPMTDGPPIKDGKSYSQLAHLAENMRPFAAVAEYLRSLGLSAPEIHSHDFHHGFLLIEDLGDDLYSCHQQKGKRMDALYQAAVDVLLKLHSQTSPSRLPLSDGGSYEVPLYDRTAKMIEVDLLAEWFWPQVRGTAMPEEIRREYELSWNMALDRLSADMTLVMRDYHSPNLLWLPMRPGPARTGLIDFQDAVLGPPAYDLVSLLQDARIDVPEARERELRTRYIQLAGFGSEQAQSFVADYALMGAQRACKILGIFTRLCHRDGKSGYLQHIPRVSAYLERNLQQPVLDEVRQWFSRHLPEQDRII